MDKVDFLAKNLRRLTLEIGSVANACRQMGINRQQFNKYMAGTHRPSNANGQRIANFFGVSYFELCNSDLNREDQLVLSSALALTKLPYWTTLQMASRGPEIRSYHGRYLGHHFSVVRPGKIVTYLMLIYPWAEHTASTALERFPTLAGSEVRHQVSKSHGLVAHLEDKIYIADLEMTHQTELGFMIFNKPARISGEYLFGVRASVEGGHLRRPFTSSTILRRIDPGVSLATLVRATTVQEEADSALPEDILDYLRSNLPR